MAISMLKIRRPLGRLIFNMGIAIPGKTVFLIETAPWAVATGWVNEWWNLVAKVARFGVISEVERGEVGIEMGLGLGLGELRSL